MNNFSQSSVSTVQPSIDEGDWVWIQSHQCMGKVVEKSFLWGNTIFRVWLPSTDAVIRVSISEISPVQSHPWTLTTCHTLHQPQRLPTH